MKIEHPYRMHEFIEIPDSKKMTGKICFIGYLTLTNSDLDSDIHKGFTIGNGKTIYWMMLWSKSGNVTVFSHDKNDHSQPRRRWISGDTEITVHFI